MLQPLEHLPVGPVAELGDQIRRAARKQRHRLADRDAGASRRMPQRRPAPAIERGIRQYRRDQALAFGVGERAPHDTVSPPNTMVFLAVGIGLNVPLLFFYNWFAHRAFRGKLISANGNRDTPDAEVGAIP